MGIKRDELETKLASIEKILADHATILADLQAKVSDFFGEDEEMPNNG